MTDRSDRGSASIWVLACALLVLSAGYLVGVRTTAVLLRHRAEAAADLAALAAASAIGVSASPCSAAEKIALANAASLVSCRVSTDLAARSGLVVVQVSTAATLAIVGEVRAVASAHAGRGT